LHLPSFFDLFIVLIARKIASFFGMLKKATKYARNFGAFFYSLRYLQIILDVI